MALMMLLFKYDSRLIRTLRDFSGPKASGLWHYADPALVEAKPSAWLFISMVSYGGLYLALEAKWSA